LYPARRSAGLDWVFKASGLRFGFKGLISHDYPDEASQLQTNTLKAPLKIHVKI
jgi:hypothetical protein